jgi:hypothetical protein
MSDYRVITTAVMPDIATVRLYDETLDHVRKEHPEVPAELPCIVGAVETAIVSPTHIEQGHGASYVFVSEETTNATGNPLRVPVKPLGEGSARVQTFYFAETSGVRNIVWRRSDA